MSRFTVTPIETEPPSARDADDVGVIYDQFEAASASVDEENYAQEGLTSELFNTGTVYATEEGVVTSTGTLTTLSSPYAGTWSQVALDAGATPFRITPSAQVPSGEYFRINLFLNVSRIFTPRSGSPPTDIFELQFRLIGYNGAADVKLTGAEWKRVTAWSAGPVSSTLEQGRQAQVQIEHWLGASDYDYIEAQYLFTVNGANPHAVDIANGTFVIDRIRAVETVT